MINALQIIVCLPSFSLQFPSNAAFFLNIFVSISNFQFMDTTSIYGKILPVTTTTFVSPPENLQSVGINSISILSNVGVIIGFVIAGVCAMVIVYPFKKRLLRIKRCKSLITILISTLYYNGVIRSLIEGYLSISLSTMLALSYLSFSNPANIQNSILAIISFIFIIAFPIFSWDFLQRNHLKLEKEEFKVKFDSFYEGIKIGKGLLGFMLTPIFLLRRIALAGTILFLGDFIVAQLFIQTMISLYYLQFLIEIKPFVSRKTLLIEIFNEFTISSCFYLSYLFTDYVESTSRTKLGYLFIGVIFFNVLVNFLIILQSSLAELWQLLKRLRIKHSGIKQNKVQVLTIITQSVANTSIMNDSQWEFQVSEQNRFDAKLRENIFVDPPLFKTNHTKLEKTAIFGVQTLQNLNFDNSENIDLSSKFETYAICGDVKVTKF